MRVDARAVYANARCGTDASPPSEPSELKDCAPSDIQVVSDEWSDGRLPNCTFPFYYRGQVYYDCTNIDYGGRYWCANDCHFSKLQMTHRGVCNLPNASPGVFGTGINLSIVNAFIALLLTAAFILSAVLCVAEWRQRRNRQVEDSSFQLPGFQPQRSSGPQGGAVQLA